MSEEDFGHIIQLISNWDDNRQTNQWRQQLIMSVHVYGLTINNKFKAFGLIDQIVFV